jgi:hypothetical protein
LFQAIELSTAVTAAPAAQSPSPSEVLFQAIELLASKELEALAVRSAAEPPRTSGSCGPPNTSLPCPWSWCGERLIGYEALAAHLIAHGDLG